MRDDFSVYVELEYVSSIGELYCTADLVDFFIYCIRSVGCLRSGLVYFFCSSSTVRFNVISRWV